MGADAPRRPKLRPSGDENKQRSPPTSFGNAAQKVEGSRMAQCRSSTASTLPVEPGHWPLRRPSSPTIADAVAPLTDRPGRDPAAAECRATEPAAQHSLLGQASSGLVNSPGLRGAAPRAHRHRRTVDDPNRRLGAAACFAEAANNSIRSRCAACPAAGHEIPRLGEICPSRARP